MWARVLKSSPLHRQASLGKDVEELWVQGNLGLPQLDQLNALSSSSNASALDEWIKRYFIYTNGSGEQPPPRLYGGKHRLPRANGQETNLREIVTEYHDLRLRHVLVFLCPKDATPAPRFATRKLVSSNQRIPDSIVTIKPFNDRAIKNPDTEFATLDGLPYTGTPYFPPFLPHHEFRFEYCRKDVPTGRAKEAKEERTIIQIVQASPKMDPVPYHLSGTLVAVEPAEICQWVHRHFKIHLEQLRFETATLVKNSQGRQYPQFDFLVGSLMHTFLLSGFKHTITNPKVCEHVPTRLPHPNKFTWEATLPGIPVPEQRGKYYCSVKSYFMKAGKWMGDEVADPEVAVRFLVKSFAAPKAIPNRNEGKGIELEMGVFHPRARRALRDWQA